MSIPSFVRPGTAVVYTVSAGNIVSSGSTDTLIALSVSPTAAIVREVLQNTSGTTTVSDHTFVPGTSAGYGYQFWVDPADPTGSISGPFLAGVTVSGTATINNVSATVLAFSFSPGAPSMGNIDYQTSTGLVLVESAAGLRTIQLQSIT